MNRLFANQWPLIPSQQISGGQEFIGLADITGFLRHYVVTITACLAVALLVAWFYISTTDPVFTASAQILIEPKLPQHLQEGGEINLSLDTAQVESQIAVMESEKIASMVIDRLSLIDDARFNHPVTPVMRERFTKMREAFSQTFGAENVAWLTSILDKLGLGVPVPAEPLTDYQKARRGMSIFRNSLDIRRVGVSYAIDISFTCADPEGAARIANATAEAFVQEQIETKAEAARQGGAWLEKRLQQLRTQMNEAMAKAQEFRSRHDCSVGGAPNDGDVLTNEPTLEELEVTADTYKKMYESFLQAYTNSVSQQSYPVADARVITSATAPLAPSAPKPKLVLVFAGVAGLILGIAISFIRHSFDWTIRSPQQIRDSLAVECVGELPRTRRRREFGHLDEVARRPRSRYSQSLRKTRTEISLAETSHPVKILGITAVENSRQKSSIVSNLATLYSMAGLKTLVVDADVQKSFLTARLLGRTGPADPSRQSIVHAPERLFDVLPSSAVEAWNLREPKNMQAFLTDIGAGKVAGCGLAAHDIVIVDMPTLVSGADDLIVGSALDGVIVVAEWGRTHVETLRELVRTLQAGRTQVLGVLLAGGRAVASKHRRALPKHSSFGTRQSV
jgi:uncharacterized protein involved in exopolysaccharide biosynthesis/Mrp family chromosome partitioning ATPase